MLLTRLWETQADLAAARRENATLREALERIEVAAQHEQLGAVLRLLKRARGYVEEPGAPGTEIVTTPESAERSAALLTEIDAALAASPAAEEPQP